MAESWCGGAELQMLEVCAEDVAAGSSERTDGGECVVTRYKLAVVVVWNVLSTTMCPCVRGPRYARGLEVGCSRWWIGATVLLRQSGIAVECLPFAAATLLCYYPCDHITRGKILRPYNIYSNRT